MRCWRKTKPWVATLGTLVFVWFAFATPCSARAVDLECRIAASPAEGRRFSTSTAAESRPTEVLAEPSEPGRWVPMAQRALEDRADTRQLVIQDGRLLVLYTGDDLVDSVRRIDRTTDGRGEPMLRVSLDPAGSAQLMRLTQRNVGRMLAVIMDGKVRAIAPIRSAVSDRFFIPAAGAADVSIPGRGSAPPGGIRLAIDVIALRWDLFVAAVVAVAVLLAAIPTRSFVRTPCPRAWRVALLILGGLYGGCSLGFGKRVGSSGHVMTITYTVSILWSLVGAVDGGAAGWFLGAPLRFVLLRALHNAVRPVLAVGRRHSAGRPK